MVTSTLSKNSHLESAGQARRSALREETVPQPCRCASCSGPLEPAQELRFLVESANLDNPAYLALIRRLPAVNGRPVPGCKAVQTHSEWSRRPVRVVRPLPVRTAVLATVGLLSVGWLFQTLLTGPRR